MLIQHDGRIFWRGREVESDDDFRAAMLDVAKCLQSSAQGSVPMLAYNALLAEVEGLRRDAERFRWLAENRSGNTYGSVQFVPDVPKGTTLREAIDKVRAIDAALAPKAPA